MCTHTTESAVPSQTHPAIFSSFGFPGATFDAAVWMMMMANQNLMAMCVCDVCALEPRICRSLYFVLG